MSQRDPAELVRPTAKPDEHELKATEQRLAQAGLPDDGAPEAMPPSDSQPSDPDVTPANQQTGTNVVKGELGQTQKALDERARNANTEPDTLPR
jgi:hypothetical protein